MTKRRIAERRIVGHHPKVVGLHLDLAQIDRADGVVGDRKLVGLPRPVIGDGNRIPCHGFGPFSARLHFRFGWIHCNFSASTVQRAH